MCYQTGKQGAGQLVYEDLSRKIKITNKKYVGFEIDGAIPPWESLRKNRVSLKYNTRTVLNFSNYTRRKEKRAEGIIKYKHKYTITQQVIFWSVLIKLLASRLVENKAMITFPHIGKLILVKVNKKVSYYDTTEKRYKPYLNLHTFRKFITTKFEKNHNLNAPTVKYIKGCFIKHNIHLHYLRGVGVYNRTLDKIKTKYALH